jgi:hypothetical protein
MVFDELKDQLKAALREYGGQVAANRILVVAIRKLCDWGVSEPLRIVRQLLLSQGRMAVGSDVTNYR